MYSERSDGVPMLWASALNRCLLQTVPGVGDLAAGSPAVYEGFLHERDVLDNLGHYIANGWEVRERQVRMEWRGLVVCRADAVIGRGGSLRGLEITTTAGYMRPRPPKLIQLALYGDALEMGMVLLTKDRSSGWSYLRFYPRPDKSILTWAAWKAGLFQSVLAGTATIPCRPGRGGCLCRYVPPTPLADEAVTEPDGTALDELAAAWLVAKRTGAAATAEATCLAGRLRNRMEERTVCTTERYVIRWTETISRRQAAAEREIVSHRLSVKEVRGG